RALARGSARAADSSPDRGTIGAVSRATLVAVQGSRRTSQPAAAAGRRRADRPEYGTFEHLPLTTLVVRTSDQEPLYVSPQIEQLLGLTPAQAVAEDDLWNARLHPDDREGVVRAWRAWVSHAGAEPFRSSYRMVGENERVVWVQDVSTFVPPDG